MTAFRAYAPAMEPRVAPIERLVAHLADVPDRWPDLLAIQGRRDFAEAVCVLARDWQLDMTPDQVMDELELRRRTWLGRWV